MVSTFIISVKLDSCLACHSGSAKGACCVLKIPGTCDGLHAQGQSQSDNWEHENSREQQHFVAWPNQQEDIEGSSSSDTSSFKYLGKELVTTFGSVVVSFFWFDQWY